MPAPYQHIVILTGAGISAESGLATFRGDDGLWEDYRVEEVATPEAYAANPALVQDFYNMRRAGVLSVEPNAAHLALAKLQRDYPSRVTLVTQNVDDLHERGGSDEVIHMHGEVLKAHCDLCGHVYAWEKDLTPNTYCDHCAGNLRPHIVWFGEIPLRMDEIETALSTADCFVAIGTSGKVYPAAGYVMTARYHGAHTVEINLDPSDTSSLFTEQHLGPATETVPEWVDKLLASAV